MATGDNLTSNVPAIPSGGSRAGVVESGSSTRLSEYWAGACGPMSSGSDDVPAGTGDAATIAFDTTGKFIEDNGHLTLVQPGGDAETGVQCQLMNRYVAEVITNDHPGRFWLSSRDGGTLRVFTGAKPMTAIVGLPSDLSGCISDLS